MGAEQNPFRLEGEDDDGRPEGGPGEERNGFELEEPAPPAPRSRPPPEAPHAPADAARDESGIDTRTVAERRGRAVGPVAGRRPPPPGWPREVFAFPLRPPGRASIAGGAGLLVLLDAAGWANLFAGLVLKLLVLPFFVRWQLHVASMSAGGRDEPQAWLDVADLDARDFRRLLRLLGLAVLLLLPGALLLAFSGLLEGLALLLLGSLWLAVAALGTALDDPGLAWPWRALAWIGAHPLGLLLGAASWWAAAGVEVLALRLGARPFATALLAFALLRLLHVYGWLLSARALGVVGRAWSPFDEGEPA